MSLKRVFLIGTFSLFSLIVIFAVFKKSSSKQENKSNLVTSLVKAKEGGNRIEKKERASSPLLKEDKVKPSLSPQDPLLVVQDKTPVKSLHGNGNSVHPDPFPHIDRINQLFTIGPNKLPIVETITYTTTVPWLKGRPAWIADYASYYSTSRHFIARSLNGKPDYFSQKISSGSQFNVFRKDKHIQFYLLVDLSSCKMGFYYIDLDSKERIFLKTYQVGLGRLDPHSFSGSLTPLGTYLLGSKVAIYKPGTMGYFQDQSTEMIQVFGTRWIPFDQQLNQANSAKGYGIHGAPWIVDPQTGSLVEDRESIGHYESDGCIRLSLSDMEELFAIVITKPTIVEIIKDFKQLGSTNK